MVPKTSSLWRNLRAYQIYGANTNVGKTVISTILCKSLARSNPAPKIWYLKPISTGPLAEADDRHISRFSPEANTRCLFQFDEAVSPHIAARSKPVCHRFYVLTNTDHEIATVRSGNPRWRVKVSYRMFSVWNWSCIGRNRRRRPFSNPEWLIPS